MADIVAFVGHVVPDEGAYIDQSGKKCLSMLRALGLPVTTGLLVVSPSLPSQYPLMKSSCSVEVKSTYHFLF